MRRSRLFEYGPRSAWPIQEKVWVNFVPATSDDQTKNADNHGTQRSSGEEIGQWYSRVTSDQTKPDVRNGIQNSTATTKVHSQRPSIRFPACTLATEASSTAISAFLRAAQQNDISHLKLCLDLGMNINVIDQYGWTALMCAACNGCMQAVKYLMERGADRRVVDNSGTIAWQLARKNGHLAIAKLLLTSVGANATGSSFSSKPKEFQQRTSESKSVVTPLTSIKVERAIDSQPVATSTTSIKVEPTIDSQPGATSSYNNNISVDVNDEEAHECLTCRLTFSGADWKSHLTSTLHQFNTRSEHVQHSGIANYHIPESNVGFQLMLKDGWDREAGLGPDGAGARYPPKIILKRDRKGLGNRPASKAKITHFGPNDMNALKRQAKPFSVRQITKRDKERMARKERQKEINFRRELNS